MLAMKTSTVKFVQKGEQGKQGVMPYPCGKWEPNITYVRTDQATPFVLYDTGKPDLDIHYILNRAGDCVGVNPVTSVANNDGVWQKFDRINYLFTKFAMIDKALLAGAVCSDDKMFSQFGSINGVDSEDYTNPNFDPYLLLDWRTGDMFARNGVYSGNMRIKFKHLADSDAIYDEQSNWWIINNDVNIICGEEYRQTVVLNPKPENDGMIVTISNIAHPPYSRQGFLLATNIYYPIGIAGVDVANNATDSIPTSISIIGGVVRLIGILEHPDDNILKWTVLSNSKKLEQL